MPSILTRIFGSANDRMLKRLWPIVREISDLEEEFKQLPDEAFREKCLVRMREFAASGTTMVIVTHDAQFVLRECTRAIWIEAGQIRGMGAPAEVVEAYHSHLTVRLPGAALVG